jgi:RHS repeat-associated protein
MKSFRTPLFIICFLAFQLIFALHSSAQCIHSIYPSSASIPGLGGNDYIYLTTEECEYYEAYTNDEWFYVWVDYYEEIITVYADPNTEGYRQGTLIIDNYDSESDFEVPVSQEYGCEQLEAPAIIRGSNVFCPGTNVTFSISPVSGANFYHWAVDGNSVPNSYDTIATIYFGYSPSTAIVTACGYNECGDGLTISRQITLHFAPLPGSISGSQTIDYNTAPSTLTSTANSSDCLGQCYYQWQSSFTGTGNWNNIQGATNSTFDPGVLKSTKYYRRAATDNCGTAYSNIVKITVSFPEASYMPVNQLPDPESRSLNTSYLVGATNGVFSVDPTGGASYTIPIEVLPGVNGLTPGISLAYTSNSNAGTAGFGWNISGLSTIGRGPQTIYNDGAAKGIELNSNDRFFIDGQRLVNTSSSYGSADAQYQTENDIFTRVTPQSTDGNGPSWFKAETKAGLFYEYGNTPESKQIIDGYQQILNWYVSKITDQYGNQISFKYLQDHSLIYPEEISYGPNKILFSYKSRSDKNISYFNGATIEQWLLLDKITVSYNSTVVKTYELKYSYQSPYNSYSLLNEIIEYGTGTSRFNSTAFSYQLNAVYSNSLFKPVTTHEYVTYKSKLIPGDFNGDGKTDLLCLPITYRATWTGIKVFVSDGDGNFTQFFTETTSLPCSPDLDIRSLDLNADGYDDILYEEGTVESSTFKYMLYDGNSFTEPSSIVILDRHPHTGLSGRVSRVSNLTERDQEMDNELTSADYNGDGINDVFLNDPDGDWYIKSFGNSYGQLTSSLGELCRGNLATLCDQVETGDFNGDGKADIWSIEENGFKIYTFNGSNLQFLYSETWLTNKHFFSLGDFNADGKVDVFLYGSGKGETESDWSSWQIKLSTGTGFVSYSIQQKKSNLKDDDFRSGDFNGDGSTDIMARTPDNSYEYFFISNNRGTDFDATCRTLNPYSHNRYHLGDYDGDGQIDQLFVDRDSLPWWNGYQIWKTTGNTKTLLGEIGNGLGALTSLTYTKLSQYTNFEKGTGAVFPILDFSGPLNVVASVQSDNGIGSLNTQSYYYEGAKIHLQGKGFLGYSKSKTSDVASGIENETISSFNSTYYYPQSIMSLSKLSGTTDTISKISNTWSQIVLDSPKKRIFPYVQSSIQIDKLTGNTIAVENSVDNYGNLTSSAKEYDNGVTEEITNTYENIISSSQWLIGRPTTTTKEYSNQDTTITRSVSRVFSTSNNNLNSETWFAGTNYQVAYTFGYNSNGTLQYKTATSGGISRSTSYTYESDNIRIHTITDPLTHVTTNTYDNIGRLYSQQDFLGDSITYQYDDLGRQNNLTSSDGNQSSTVYSWEDPASVPAYGRYSILKTGNDGSQGKNWYDKLGRELRSDVKGFDGTMIYSSTVYNTKGQVESVSDPYYSTGTALLNTFSYDDYGRKTGHTRPSGRNSEWGYNNNTTTETTGGKSFSRTYDSDGTMSSATDAGGTITYSYYPDGKAKAITAPGSIITSIQYDIAGNQSRLVDPSAGTTTYVYNGFGELTSQVNAKNDTSTVTYNADGSVAQKVTPEGTTSYTYNSNKQLTSISSPGNVSRSFGYDSKGRVTSITETIPDSSSFTTSYTYDNIGRPSTITHPSGITETNNYNSNGYLSSVSAGGAVRWTTTGINARQQVTSGQYGSNLNATYGYDSYGFPTSTATGSIQDYSYNFNTVTGNINWRQNNKYSNLREDFNYDDLDRLDSIYMGSTTTLEMEYHSNKAGIITKNDVGTLLYETPEKPYAVSGINPTTGLVPDSTQTVSYTSFESVSTISENPYYASFTYSSDNERAKMVVQSGGTTIFTRWYPTSSYLKETAGSVTKEYTYIGGDAYSAPVVAVTENGSTSYYYLLRDYLGNLTHVVNTSNSLVAEYSYDAWGRMRNPSTWVNYGPGSEPTLFTGRGFTGHEHLPWFNIINMNGRLYDPLLGIFLSPDNFVQSPDFTQNFNRYAYCLNNPLKYTDPSGDLLTWSFNKNGFSIGLNFGFGGFGINIGWSDGGSIGFYGELGPRIGNTGLTVSQSFDYSFRNDRWSTTTSLGGATNFGWLNVGGNLSYTYGNQGGFNWGVSAGYNYGNDTWGLAPNIGYGSGGWTYGVSGYYNPPKPTVIKFDSSPYNGEPVPNGCDAMTMYTIDPSYTLEQWSEIIKKYTHDGSDGSPRVEYTRMYSDYGLEYLNTPNANMSGADIHSIANQGYNYLSLTVDNYYNILGEGPGVHRMAVNEAKIYPNKVKLHVSDWGQGRPNNGIYNYSMVYRMGRTNFNPLYFTFYRRK